MTDQADYLQMIKELREMNRWLRVLAAPVLRERLEKELRTADDRRIYQASTDASSRDVAAAAGVSDKGVRNAWKRWAAAGIVIPTDTLGRYERITDLGSVGIEVEAPTGKRKQGPKRKEEVGGNGE